RCWRGSRHGPATRVGAADLANVTDQWRRQFRTLCPFLGGGRGRPPYRHRRPFTEMCRNPRHIGRPERMSLMRASLTSRRARRGLAAAVAAGTLLTVVNAATPAMASTASAPAGDSQVVCSSDKPGLAPLLSHDIAAALDGRKGRSAMAVYDRTTGTTCHYRAAEHFDSASVVKVTVLGALLHQADEAHRRLTPQEDRWATAMITKSDNASTDALRHRIGLAGFERFLDLAERPDTGPGTARP